MDKQGIKQERLHEIAHMSRAELQIAYMNLFELSWQKTELIKYLEKKLDMATKRIEA